MELGIRENCVKVYLDVEGPGRVLGKETVLLPVPSELISKLNALFSLKYFFISPSFWLKFFLWILLNCGFSNGSCFLYLFLFLLEIWFLFVKTFRRSSVILGIFVSVLRFWGSEVLRFLGFEVLAFGFFLLSSFCS